MVERKDVAHMFSLHVKLTKESICFICCQVRSVFNLSNVVANMIEYGIVPVSGA